ncbi:MAG: 30S ribosomal protein S20 [Bacteroidota bacterium]|nr:30S ribosomal protein S20 [Bacteroidota bacterium]
MANHKSSIKRIRQTEVKNERNRYQHKTARNLIKKLRVTSDKTEALSIYAETISKIDKLAKRNIIHKNKAANLKSSLSLHVNSLN